MGWGHLSLEVVVVALSDERTTYIEDQRSEALIEDFQGLSPRRQ